MGSYFEDVYKKRASFRGKNLREQVENDARRDFASFLAESPNQETVVISGRSYQCVIESNKEDESRVTRKMFLPYNVSVPTGTFVVWGKEKWIVFFEQIKTINSYKTYLIVKTNYVLNYVDSYGKKQTTNAYILGPMSKTVQDVFSISSLTVYENPAITLALMVPTCAMEEEMRLLIGGAAWEVNTIDSFSVQGLMYITLSKSGINDEKDDIVNEVADNSQLGRVSIEIYNDTIIGSVGDTTQLYVSVFEDGRVDGAQAYEVVFDEPGGTNPAVASINGDGVIELLANGTVTGHVRLKNSQNISADFIVTAKEIVEENMMEYHIIGDRVIRVGAYADYQTVHTVNGIADSEEVSVILDNTTKATIANSAPNQYRIQANEDNLLGTITLDIAAGMRTHDIEIIALW
jgi:hypothetical protein